MGETRFGIYRLIYGLFRREKRPKSVAGGFFLKQKQTKAINYQYYVRLRVICGGLTVSNAITDSDILPAMLK